MMSENEGEVKKEEKRWGPIALSAIASDGGVSNGNFSVLFEETRKWRNYR